jgi:hypothetical protein
MAVDENMANFIQYLDCYKTKHVGYFDMNRILYNINCNYAENKYYESSFIGQNCSNPSTGFSHQQYTNPYYLLYDVSKWNQSNNLSNTQESFDSKESSVPSGTNGSNGPTLPTVPSAYDIWKKTHEANLSINEPKHEPIVKPKVVIDMSVNTLSDLINIIDTHKYSEDNEYNIDLKSLTNIRSELDQLNNMVGMSSLKCSILDQLFYFIQELHISKCTNPVILTEPESNDSAISALLERALNMKRNDQESFFDDSKSNFSPNGNPIGTKLKLKPKDKPSVEPSATNMVSDFKHTVICGPPGTGKTEVAKIIGKMYSKIGVLKKNTFKKVTRSDLVAGYLGQTALKTKTVVTDSLGGVLFIDEAYSLGNNRDTDSYSKECIDTLCEAMSDHKDDLMVIIAGYEDELNETFFSVNKGLESRFIWRFKIDEYNAAELTQIFKKKVMDTDWIFENVDEIHTKWFEQRKREFRHYGRDMELLFSFSKIAHAKRIYGKPAEMRKKISLDDLNKGYDSFLKNKKQKTQSVEIQGLYV